MPIPHHTHSGGDSGPPLRADEFLAEGTFSQAIGQVLIDPARVDKSYADFAWVEPTAGWANLFEALGKLRAFEAKADYAFTNACFVAV